MASIPPYHDPESYESSGSACLNEECSPPVLVSPCFLADSAAPVFPLNGDDLTEHALGFGRAETFTSSSASRLSSTPLDERHVFLCFKDPQSWPALVEAADFDRLPRFLAARIKLRKNEMAKKTRLTICEGRDGTESSNGDVMIFPDMIRYKGLTHFDVDTFVDEVLVQNQEWLSGRPEKLSGSHIFVCAHASHDARCGVSGPIIIGRLRREISARGLDGHVFVRPCTHVGGHKYKGNVIVYSVDTTGEVLGRCYVSATSDNVCGLLDELFGTENLVDGHRRSFHGMTNIEPVQTLPNPIRDFDDGYFRNGACQAQEQVKGLTDGKASLSLNPPRMREGLSFSEQVGDSSRCTRQLYSNYRWWQASWWFGSWEREDTLAALAVVGAATSVAVAYHLYRIHARH